MKKRMPAKSVSMFLLIVFLFSISGIQGYADQKVIWQEAVEGVYDTNIPGMILMYNDQLAYGGMDLYTGKMTKSKEAADIAYYSGTIAARDIRDLGVTDFDKVDAVPDKGYSMEQNASPGHVYIVSTHKGEFAKVVIKKVMASSLSIIYSIIKENSANNPQAVPKTDVSDKTGINAGTDTNITMQIGSSKAKVNGIEVKLEGTPSLVNNRVLIPTSCLKPILNAKVVWDSKAKKATVNYQNYVLVLQLNSSAAVVNQEKVAMDAPFQMVNGKLMIPVNILNSAFNLKVRYTGSTKTVEITGGDTQKVPQKEPASNNVAGLEYAFRTFILWVPGTSYTFSDYSSGTNTLYISGGTIPKSTLTVNKDGTYVWNSAYDAKIIRGTWTGNSEGSLDLIKGQEGKTWRLAKSDGKYEDIFIMDGSTWYSGKAVEVKNK